MSVYCPCSDCGGGGNDGSGGSWRTDVPRVGWTYDGYEDKGDATHTCDMCGKNHIRYAHRVRHQKIGSVHPFGLEVSCVCAEKMTRQITIANFPARIERALTTSLSIRDRILDDQNWTTTAKGTSYHICVFD